MVEYHARVKADELGVREFDCIFGIFVLLEVGLEDAGCNDGCLWRLGCFDDTEALSMFGVIVLSDKTLANSA